MTVWRKSSRSNGGGGGTCVELAQLPGTIGVRDSTNPTGPILKFDRRELAVLLKAVKADKHHL
ncbi:MAG: hypothetical protein JWN52_1883 [Actinomycetia bacterium]|nr:hypothetical protein [Actinomycetes bacterium]